MIKTMSVAVFAASLSFATAAFAEDFQATPMNHGPMVVHGMGPAGDIVNLGLTPVNVLTPPALAVGGAVTGNPQMAANEPMAEPAMHKHHHHSKHMMMKKKMMKKKM